MLQPKAAFKKEAAGTSIYIILVKISSDSSLWYYHVFNSINI